MDWFCIVLSGVTSGDAIVTRVTLWHCGTLFQADSNIKWCTYDITVVTNTSGALF